MQDQEKVETKEEVVEQDEKVEVVKSPEEILEDKVKELEEGRLRAAADFENYKKRAAKEREMIAKYAGEEILLSFLPVLDNMELAIKSMESDKDTATYKGVEMILTQFKDAMAKTGLTEIVALDQPFDPNYHEAVMKAPVEGKESDTVVEVLRKGYMLNDKCIRPSMVKVAE